MSTLLDLDDVAANNPLAQKQLAEMRARLAESESERHEQARLLSMSAEREKCLIAERDRLLEALHEIAAATDGADAHLMVWVADKAEAAIAKVRGGEG